LKTKLIRSVYIINKYKVRTVEREALEQQINKLKLIDHPFVNKIYELFKDSHRYFIVMELCFGESLASII
jgi:serine/threonine protein kinase